MAVQAAVSCTCVVGQAGATDALCKLYLSSVAPQSVVGRIAWVLCTVAPSHHDFLSGNMTALSST